MPDRLAAVREVEVGTGVIDCAFSSTGDLVVTGDVSGRAVVFDNDLSPVWQTGVNMPVWGSAIAERREIVSLALADKQNFKGGLSVYNISDNRLIYSVLFDAPAWGTAIDSDNGIVYSSTWGEGLFWYDLHTRMHGTIDLPGHLFGLQITRLPHSSRRLLSVTISNGGVVGFDLPVGGGPVTGSGARMLLRSEHACYRHILTDAADQIYAGSATGIVAYNNLSSDPATLTTFTRTFRTLLKDASSVVCLGELVVYGSLTGELQSGRLGRPEAPIGFCNLGEAIWNIVPHRGRDSVFIGRGDGFLAEYSASDLRDQGIGHQVDEVEFGPGSLGGAKVFVSYASEDHAIVADVYRSLKVLGCIPWMDRFDILPGQDWQFEIRKALRESDFVLACFSSKSVSKRGYVQKEIREALDLLNEIPEGEIFLIPARLENCTIPDSLARRQWVDLFEPEGLKRLCLAIYTSMTSREET